MSVVLESEKKKGQCWTVELGMDLTVPVDIIVYAKTEDDARSDAERIVKEVLSKGHLSHLSKFYPRHVKADGIRLNAVAVQCVKGGLQEIDEGKGNDEVKKKCSEVTSKKKNKKSEDASEYLAGRIRNSPYSETQIADDVKHLIDRKDADGGGIDE